MRWKVVMEGPKGFSHNGVAHYVHRDKRGAEVHFVDGRAVFVKDADIVHFNKRQLRK